MTEDRGTVTGRWHPAQKELVHLKQLFKYDHLPLNLQMVSKVYADIVDMIEPHCDAGSIIGVVLRLVKGYERELDIRMDGSLDYELAAACEKLRATAISLINNNLSGAARHLLEAKDCAVRSAVLEGRK